MIFDDSCEVLSLIDERRMAMLLSDQAKEVTNTVSAIVNVESNQITQRTITLLPNDTNSDSSDN